MKIRQQNKVNRTKSQMNEAEDTYRPHEQILLFVGDLLYLEKQSLVKQSPSITPLNSSSFITNVQTILEQSRALVEKVIEKSGRGNQFFLVSAPMEDSSPNSKVLTQKTPQIAFLGRRPPDKPTTCRLLKPVKLLFQSPELRTELQRVLVFIVQNTKKSLLAELFNAGEKVPVYLLSIYKRQMSALQQIRQAVKDLPDNLNLLNLSQIKIGAFTEEIKKELQRFKKVKVLMLRQCGLSDLDNLPHWKLSAIDLSQNNFGEEIIAKLCSFNSLTQILLMENSQIKSIQNLKQLSCLKHLTELDFTDCPVTNEPNYRPILFDTLKGLQVLDQHDLSGELVADQQDNDDSSEYQQDGVSDEQDYEEDEQVESSEKPKKKKK